MTAAEHPNRHRLVAILVADVAGYSRLMALDDQATVRALDAGRRAFAERVAANGGRVVDMAGDAVLAIFDTAVGALRAALEVQDRLGGAELAVAEGERMRFRIGVHLGDVIEKPDGTVYGDGVNIAARLEGLAEPGGIAVSQAIEAAIHHRLNVRFVDLGAQQVKNIAQPVHAFRCEPVAGADVAVAPRAAGARTWRRRSAVLGATFVSAAAVLAAAWFAVRGWLEPSAPAAYSARDRRMTFAVLPFAAPAGDGDGARIAAAVGETAAAYQEKNVTWAQVVPRALAADAARAHADVRALGRALDVHFLLRGVVVADPQGHRVDIAVVDTLVDRVLATRSVVIPAGALLPKRKSQIGDVLSRLTLDALISEVERVRAKPVEALDVRDLSFRAFADWVRAGTTPSEARQAHDNASRLLQRALAAAPDDLLALHLTAMINLCTCVASWSKDVQEQQAVGIAAMEKVLRRRPESPTMLLAKADLYRHHGKFEESLVLAETVLRQEPEHRAALVFKTFALLRLGRIDDALATSALQMQLFDDDPRVTALAAAVRYAARDDAAAADFARKAIALMERPELADPIAGTVALTLVAAEGRLGHRSRAAAALRDLQSTVPAATTIAAIRQWMHADADLAGHEPLFDGLRLAGFAD